ncbi:MAG: hypothetical protein CMH27_05175 [Micavibrio sp.]|nr:hypothetical protein [Micavibrio sp.]|tara:strand:- start:257 stop:667 length:411 start_codon:yes stop_codon:yes gene_type:complete
MQITKPASIYCALILVSCILLTGLYGLLVQSRTFSAQQWSSHSLDLHHRSLNGMLTPQQQDMLSAEALDAMNKAVYRDPYNPNYWVRLVVMNKGNEQNMLRNSEAMGIAKLLKPDIILHHDQYIVPLNPARQKISE